MFFLLNAPPTLLITKGQGSQTICNSISTDYNRNLTIIYVVIFNPCMLCYILIAIYILPSYMKKKTCQLKINKNKIVMEISYLCK